jgi:hypothetical protein
MTPETNRSPATTGALTWLRGDMHNHCERPELLEEHLAGGVERLDFAALTNHAQKPIFFEQHEMIARGRELYPDFPLFFGMEWNAAGGRHANILFSPSTDESAHAYALSRAYDRHVEGSNPDIAGALRQLGEIDHPPILFFNHPQPGDWSTEVVDEYLSCPVPVPIVAGLEAVHGHQAQPRGVRLDHDHYPGCAVGGLADHVYEKGIPLALLAHSDFHVHKQAKAYDYPLGVFSHTRVGVSGSSFEAEDILAAIRAGRTCACQGHWLDLADFSISAPEDGVPALIGDRWSSPVAAHLTISLSASEALQSVDLIGRLSSDVTTSIIKRFGPQPAGVTNQTFAIPPGARGHVRLRVISESHERPAPGQTAPKAFFTSAILLG